MPVQTFRHHEEAGYVSGRGMHCFPGNPSWLACATCRIEIPQPSRPPTSSVRGIQPIQPCIISNRCPAAVLPEEMSLDNMAGNIS